VRSPTSRSDWAVDEAVLRAVDGLRPHVRPGPPRPRGGQGEHAAVRRAVTHLRECWDERVTLVELAAVAEVSRSELAALACAIRVDPACVSRPIFDAGLDARFVNEPADNDLSRLPRQEPMQTRLGRA
jgi:hypothetical protein